MKKTKLILSTIIAICTLGCADQKNQSENVTVDQQTATADIPVDNYMGAYAIIDDSHGTKTTVVIDGDKRIMTSNGLPNHKTGKFPNADNPNTISAQSLKYTFPINPVYTGKPKPARETGVALNGIKFQPGTAEKVVCESGEMYRIEAFQDLLGFGLDFNNAHVQPHGAYHYHGVPTSLIEQFDKGEDLVHIGFAHDGFAIYYSKSGAYKPSYKTVSEPRTGLDCLYENPHQKIEVDMEGSDADGTFVSDWEYEAGLGDLDACNGIEVKGTYMYIITEGYPFIGRCLMGEFTEPKGKGPPPGGQPHNHDHPHDHPPGGGHQH